jgi:hypothetical protein
MTTTMVKGLVSEQLERRMPFEFSSYTLTGGCEANCNDTLAHGSAAAARLTPPKRIIAERQHSTVPNMVARMKRLYYGVGDRERVISGLDHLVGKAPQAGRGGGQPFECV